MRLWGVQGGAGYEGVHVQLWDIGQSTLVRGSGSLIMGHRRGEQGTKKCLCGWRAYEGGEGFNAVRMRLSGVRGEEMGTKHCVLWLGGIGV